MAIFTRITQEVGSVGRMGLHRCSNNNTLPLTLLAFMPKLARRGAPAALPCHTSLAPLALLLASHCAADQLVDEEDPFVRLTLTMNMISNGMTFCPKMSVSDI